MYSIDIQNLAIKLYHKLSSLRKVASIIGTSHSTISRWKNLIKLKRKLTTKKLDGSCILDTISLFIQTHPFCTIKDIREVVKNNFNIEVSLELVRMFIKKNNFTRKRVRYYSKPKDDEIKLKLFIDKRSEYLKENRNFVSIDETSFGRNYQSASGYSKKGERLYIKRPTATITTHSVVSAVSIGSQIVMYKKEGSFNSESFSNFLRKLKLPEKSVLIMDNVSFHHSKVVKEVIKEKNWDVLYTVPYSPIFNPIEGVFSIVKRHYQKFMSIEKSFESVTNSHIISFFRQSFNAVSRF